MVYKKYIYKKGKKFGPYYYESYRIGNKTKKRYLGTSLPSPIFSFFKSRAFISFFFLLFLSGVILLSHINHSSILGRLILDESLILEKDPSMSIPESAENQEAEVPVEEPALEIPEEPSDLIAANLEEENKTPFFNVMSDTTFPLINFTSPTPADRSIIEDVFVNVSSSDDNGQHYAFLDWNKSLVLWMRMNNETGENDTLVKDFSSYSNNGTAYNDAAPAADGKFGGAWSFDGVNDYIDVQDSDSLDLSSGLGISLWFKPQASFGNLSDYNQGVLDKGSYKLYLDRLDGKLKFSIDSNNTKNWSALGTGLSSFVYCLGVYNNELYAGGSNIIGVSKWNSTAWSALGTGIDNDVYSLAVYNEELYAGGYFSIAGGVNANYSAKWNSTAWSPLGTGMNGEVYSFAVYDGKLYAGGYFTTADRLNASSIARWNGSDWSALGSGIVFNGPVYSLAVYNNQLYAGGGFTTAGEATVNYIARWNGTGWAELGAGMSLSVTSLAVYNNELYAGGYFTTAGAVSANMTARWNGSEWSALGSGMNSAAMSLAVYNGELYAAGYFTRVGGASINYTARWNGSEWRALGSGTNAGLRALAVHKGELYAAGVFTTAGGASANNIAKWSSGFEKEISSVKNSWTGWSHVFASYNHSQLNIYVNGALENNISAGTYLNKNIFRLLLGTSHGSGSSENFNGNIDDVLIFNRALSEQEVKALYDANANQYYNNFTSQPDGSYNYTAWAVDLAGNVNSTETRNVILETQYPAIYIYSPQNITYGNATILVNFSASDATLDRKWYYNKSSNVTYTSSHYLTLSPGSHTLIFYANDSLGRLNQTSATFLIVLETEKPKVYAISPANNAVDADGNLTLNCSATDNGNVNKISLYFNDVVNQTDSGVYGSSVSVLFNISNLADGSYNWSCYACDENLNCNQSQTKNITVNKTSAPVYNASYFSGNTTNWNQLEDITNVCNGTAILENAANGLIQWNGCVNAQNTNFDSYVVIGRNNVTVNFGLNLSFNSSATIKIKNLTWNAAPIILKDGALCQEPDCSNISYNATTGLAVFNVSHFTSYATSGNSQMTIWDETDTGMPYADLNKTQDEQAKFFANYSRTSNNQQIATATCTIKFNDFTGTMGYNSTSLVYDYNRSFANNGTFAWNASCSATGFEAQTANDTIIILADTMPPNVTSLVPSSGASYLVNSSIEISANVTDTRGISSAKANITLPNSTIQQITLNNASGDKYNSSFLIPESLTGQYNITFIANDTKNNINSSEKTYFIASTSPTPVASASSGGGGRSTERKGFALDREMITVSLKSGETKIEYLTILNTKSLGLDVTIDLGYLENFIKISEKSFSLGYSENKTLKLTIISKDQIMDSYIGKITVKADGITKEINVIINVEEKEPLLQAEIQIPKKSLLKTDNLEANIIITKKEAKTAESKIYYFIKDSADKVYFSETESVNLGAWLEISRTFKLPEELEYKNYLLQVWVESGNKTSISTESFSVFEKELPSFQLPLMILLLALIIILVLYAVWRIAKQEEFESTVDATKIDEAIGKRLYRYKFPKRRGNNK